MKKELGLGLLSLSGKYKERNKRETIKEIRNINSEIFDFVDAAYVYKDLHIDALDLLARNNLWNNKKLNIKIGRDLNKSCDEIFNELKASIPYGWIGEIFIMFHQVEGGSYDKHMKIIDLIKKYLSLDYLEYGLSIHSFDQLKGYKNDTCLKKVQIPFNAVDEYKVRNIIDYCKKYDIKIQARSILGAGLFSGNYKSQQFGGFKDPIRKQWNFENKEFKFRYEKFLKICEILDNFRKSTGCKFLINEIMELFVLTNKNVSEIICGGSNYAQINQFQRMKSIPGKQQLLVLKDIESYLNNL